MYTFNINCTTSVKTSSMLPCLPKAESYIKRVETSELFTPSHCADLLKLSSLRSSLFRSSLCQGKIKVRVRLTTLYIMHPIKGLFIE